MSTALKSKSQPNSVVALLNEALAGALDLKMQAKQAHWNVKGDNFKALHELFDAVAAEADGYADLIAERAVQLGGTALGTVQSVAEQTSLPAYAMDLREGQQHLKAVSKAIKTLADSTRAGIDTVTSQGDAVTADVLTEVTRGLDKQRWFVDSHLQ